MKQVGIVCSLTVAASAFGAFSDRDIAFYPFRDGEPGVSAVGVSLTNAVGATYPDVS